MLTEKTDFKIDPAKETAFANAMRAQFGGTERQFTTADIRALCRMCAKTGASVVYAGNVLARQWGISEESEVTEKLWRAIYNKRRQFQKPNEREIENGFTAHTKEETETEFPLPVKSYAQPVGKRGRRSSPTEISSEVLDLIDSL